jgi:hypothetical protein
VIRAGVSVVSAVENTLDALDTSDVVTGVVGIRDQGGLFSGVLRKLAICEDDFAGFGGREDGCCRGCCHGRCHVPPPRAARRFGSLAVPRGRQTQPLELELRGRITVHVPVQMHVGPTPGVPTVGRRATPRINRRGASIDFRLTRFLRRSHEPTGGLSVDASAPAAVPSSGDALQGPRHCSGRRRATCSGARRSRQPVRAVSTT